MQHEIKIADFNYKLLHNIIPTGKNLLKWNKIDNASCIYCRKYIHDIKHMLWDCSCVYNMWKIIGNALDCVFNFQIIILGKEMFTHVNRVISLICYLIFKKYLLDKERIDNNLTPLPMYMKYELTFRLRVYENIKCIMTETKLIQKIIQMLSSVKW